MDAAASSPSPLLPPPAAPSQLLAVATSTREFSTMQRPTKQPVASASTHPSAVSDLQGWEDLPDGLLHSILPLLGSFRNLLAFAATCPSWRAAFSSYPSKCTLSPPLLIKPNYIRGPSYRHVYFFEAKLAPDPIKLRTCNVIEPANPNTTMRCQIYEETLHEMHFAGSSYGQLIFCNSQRCLLVDPFSGTEVSPPHFAVSVKCGEVSIAEVSTPLYTFNFQSALEEIREVYRRWRVPNPSDRNSPFCGVLTAPLASPSSHLLVTTRFSLFDWPVGSDSWYELRLHNAQINQIVEFNGQYIAMDDHHRIYKVQLAPQLGLQEIATEKHTHRYSWLVVCGDMLLAVAHFQIRCLDMTTKPAKWEEVKNLDNWALFLGGHAMSQPLSFMFPERWGGRSKCMYYARYSPSWSVYSLGDDADMSIDYGRSWPRKMDPLWLYPSMFY